MLPDFVKSWRNDINNKLPLIIKSKDEAELYRFGHTLKGSARQFSMNEFSEFGASIQQCSKQQDWDLAGTLIDPMLKVLDDVEHFLVKNGLKSSDDVPSNI